MKLISSLKICCFFVLAVGQHPDLQAQSVERDYLQKEYHKKGGLSEVDLDAWRTEKVISLEKKISGLSDQEKKFLISAADSALKKDWPSLRISDLLKYKNEGNILAYYTPSNERRIHLTNLVIGELVSRKGKYLEEIANGLWLVLEESTWVAPHHIKLQKAGEGLPDPDEQIIDLRSGDISSLVGWIRLLLHDELRSMSPMIISKIDRELERKIITPFLQRDDLHWLGFGGGKVNNWNIWINTNILITALTAIDDKTIRNKVIAKTVKSADKFINNYPADGGCDEGVTYWGEAGGRLIQFIGLLTEASSNKLNWADNQLIHNMGSYIYKMHIADDQYVNFADAFAQNYPSPATVFQFGKVFNDPLLKQFAAYLKTIEKSKFVRNSTDNADFNSFVKELEAAEGISKEKPAAPLLKSNWLPDLQVLTLRQSTGSSKGLFFAVKGGHNAESHNHNDVGNFVLYLDGEPCIVDAGVDTYTKQTFSKDRYSLWNMQSQWHNCPTINGVMQKNGREFEATQLIYRPDLKEPVFELDIAKSYPAEAGVISWKRNFVFSTGKGQLVLNEKYSLNKAEVPFELNFLSSMEVIQQHDGIVKLMKNGKSLFLKFDAELFELLIENKPTGEGRLSASWGPHLTRLTLRSKRMTLTGGHKIVFTQ